MVYSYIVKKTNPTDLRPRDEAVKARHLPSRFSSLALGGERHDKKPCAVSTSATWSCPISISRSTVVMGQPDHRP